MIQINPLQSYINGGARAAITTPPSASLVFDLPGRAIWVKGVKLKGTDHTYTFSHDNYITLTNTPGSDESEDIKIGVNITLLKQAIDTTYTTGTLEQLQLGVNTTAQVWTAKILSQYVTGVLPITKTMKINGTDYAIFTTENSLPTFFAPGTLGNAGQILASTASGLTWVNQTVNTDFLVTQGVITANNDYRIILKKSANDNAETSSVNFASTLLYNPSTKILKINGNLVVTFANTYIGATSSANATAGLVPAATSAQRTYYLRGDGTWQNVIQENTWRPIKVAGTERLGSGTDTGAVDFVAGTGITLGWDATNKRITITNSAPDQNHNTDRTSIKLGTVSGTKKTDSTLISASSSTGLVVLGGTNLIKVGDGTNYIEVPITIAHGLSTKNMNVNGTNYAIYTSASSLPTFIAPTGFGSANQILATNANGNGFVWVAKPVSNVTTTAVIASSATGTSQITAAQNNPYYNLLEGGAVSRSIRFVAGAGITISAATDGQITITNASPDQNHNTDRTSIKLASVSGTKKTDSTLIIANSSTGLSIAGGTNLIKIGDGTNYIEVPITINHGLSTKNMTINGTAYALYTSASSLPTIIAPSSFGTANYILATNSSGNGFAWVAKPTSNVTTTAIVGNSATATSQITAALANPYYNLLEGGSVTRSIRFVAGTGITISAATDGLITITNSAPDVNHNTHFVTSLYIGENNDTKANAAVGNPYLKLFDDNTRRSTLRFVAGNGITIGSDANGNITITNSKPDINHNVTTTAIVGASASATTQITAAQANPYYNLLEGGAVTRSIRFVAGNGITISAATDGLITITNSKPDVNHDTHYTTHLYIGKASEASNAAIGNPYLKLYDNSTLRHQYQLKGDGASIKVDSDSSGNLTTKLGLIYCRDDSSPSNKGLWNTVKNGTSGSVTDSVRFYTIYASDGGPTTYGEMLEILSVNVNHWQPQLWFGAGRGGHMYYRNKDYNNNTWGSWLTIADSGNISNKEATIGTSLTTIATIAGVNITAKIGSYAASNHTHPLSIAADSGTSSIALAASTKYKLTAGGSTYVFTSTPDENVKLVDNNNNENVPILLKNGTGTGTITSSVRTVDGVTINPSSNSINIGGVTTIGGNNSNMGIIKSNDPWHGIALRTEVAGYGNTWGTDITFSAKDSIDFWEYSGLFRFRRITLTTNTIVCLISTSGISGNGFHHSAHDNNDSVLLAGGSYKAVSDFATSTHNHDDRYVTALGTNGNYVTWTKNGTANNLTVPYATNATYSKYPIMNWLDGTDMNTVKTPGFYAGYTMTNSGYGSISTFLILNYSNDWGTLIQFGADGRIYHRRWTGSGGVMDSTWNTIAYLSDIPTKASWNYDDVYVKKVGDTMTGTLYHNIAADLWSHLATCSSVGSSGRCCHIGFGRDASSCNLSYISHHHVADGSTSNYLTMGLYGKDELLNILANGNIGIGTTSPSAKLTVYGSNAYNMVNIDGHHNDGVMINFYHKSTIKGHVGYEASRKMVFLWNATTNRGLTLMNDGTINDAKFIVGSTQYTLIHTGNVSPALLISGNTIASSVGGVTSSYITVPYATNCDTVDSLHASDFVRAYGTTNDNIDADWGQSFKTFDPVPSGNPPESNPNISLLSIGNNFARRKMLAFIWNNDNIYYRRRVDSSFSGWVKLLHTGNSYVSNGYGVINGTTITLVANSDTVDGWHANLFAKSLTKETTMREVAKNYNSTLGMIYGSDVPGGSSGWWHLWLANYNNNPDSSGNDSNFWCSQIVNAAGTTDPYIRSRSGGDDINTGWTGWVRILTASNWTNVIQSVTYATYATHWNASNLLGSSNWEWNPFGVTQYWCWGEAFINTSVSSDTGDLRFYLAPISTAGGAGICMNIDGHIATLSNIYAGSNMYAAHFYENSDARLKHDIIPISKSIKQFKFHNDERTYYGFIALELEILHPELVDSSQEYKKVNYDSAICYYIAELENRVKELEDKLKKYENMLIKKD